MNDGRDRERAPLDTADPLRAAAGDRILRPRDIVSRVGLSRTTLWRAVRAGSFPAPVRLSVNAIGWRESEVAQWIAGRPTTRADGAA